LTMIKVAPPGSHHLDTPEQWLEGYLTADETLVNFLKMGYALRRLENNELKIHQYFDLIELSTTFD
ncbi:TPA: NTPase KAP, partial [Escherichia coli]|nr:NTPase KAP [Escherichia coli]ELP2636565.1 NTPase KAP [Escherichia coli]HCN6224329.1 NTPase KAP [Escherichia coli]HDV1596602.1 NTPase KAP [Escherichia coli]